MKARKSRANFHFQQRSRRADVNISVKVFKSEAHTANSMWTIFTLRTSGHSELHGGDWAGAVGVAGAAASGGRGALSGGGAEA